ncbi:MAG TPA: DUF4271 domain-containing protein [Bacteroidales bacterium]|jgi:hypothetical protein|nr:DUF4271 domain-containing protein [Bacteroidales bacterium]HPD24667.1 DUF4271 domain-containing protein [Bacteroidales bacterium]HRT80906.1 DUF4271 domain-containing protein [Bacteroidales bacterium]HUM33232.1 DUF4271 domain-containing protein [Bacteroidales bacterium]
MQVIERVSGYEEILILTGAFICINLWAIIKVAYKKYLSNIYIDLFKYSFQKSLNIFEKNKITFAGILVSVASVISLAVAVSSVIFYHPYFSHKLNFAPTTVFITMLMFWSFIVLLLKSGLELFGFLFDFKKQFHYYAEKSLDIFIILSIAVFPPTILIPFSSDQTVKILSLVIFILFILALLFRAIIFFYYLKEIKFLNIYSFLYFCSVEILPLLFILEVVNVFLR